MKDPCLMNQRNEKSNPACKSSVRQEFTIVELLVVIAIIGILAAMLLPALKNAKDMASQINCMNNFKHAGVTCELYTSDYGYFPATRYGTLRFDDFMSMYLPEAKGGPRFSCPAGTRSKYTCPAVPGKTTANSGGEGRLSWNNTNGFHGLGVNMLTIGVNYNLGDNPTGVSLYYLKGPNFPIPSRLMVAADAYGLFAWYGSLSEVYCELRYWHSNLTGATAVYADGHADMRKKGSLTLAGASSPNTPFWKNSAAANVRD